MSAFWRVLCAETPCASCPLSQPCTRSQLRCLVLPPPLPALRPRPALVSGSLRRVFLCQILIRLSKLCVQESASVRKSRKQQQRLLRNMGAHAVVLELLQIPYEKVGASAICA